MRMTCSLMSDRLCFTLLAITQASPNPWLIEFLYSTRGERPIEDTAHLWDTCSSIAVGVTTHRHTQTHTLNHCLTARWSWRNYSIDMWWQAQEDKYVPHIRKNLSTDSVCNSEEGNTYSTVPRSPGKVEQKMEGSEYEKVIGCNKEEVKRKGKHYWSVLRGGGIMGALCYPLVSFRVLFSTHSRYRMTLNSTLRAISVSLDWYQLSLPAL